MTATRFTPGPATAYVFDDVIAVVADAGVDAGVDAAVDPDLMSRCASPPGWPALLESIADLNTVAVVAHFDDLLRVAAVGAVTVDVEGPEGARQIDGGDELITHELAGVRTVTIRTAGVGVGDEPTHCVDDGVVPASLVSRHLVTPAAAASDPFDALFGTTEVRTVETAAVRPDDAGVGRDATPIGVLVFSTGARVVVDRTIVLGRNPRHIDGPGGEATAESDPRRVKVAAPGVSRRHALIRVDRWHASIDDLGSSNGTRVALPGRTPMPIRPGRPVDLVPGAVVDLGGEVSFAVEEVA